MNIFHIPSWYPNQKEPLEGSFIKNFIYRFADIYKDSNHIISNQQENSFSLLFKKPGASIKEIIGFLKTMHREMTKSEGNVMTLYTPGTLAYSEALGFDPLATLEKKHRRNFEKALEIFHGIDLIHAHVTFPAGIFARKIGEHFNIPYIITEHSGPFPFDFILKNEHYLKELKLALNSAETVVSVSNTHARDVMALTHTPVKVIFNQVQPANAPQVPRTDDAEFLVLLSAAISLDRKKGIPQLLDAFAAVRNEAMGKKMKLWLVGEADAALLAQIGALDLTDSVRLYGKVAAKHMQELIGQCDIFVLPSQKESFGLVYVEAAMAGKPIIATRCGGPEDIVNDDNGLLIPVDDPVALQNALLFMSKNSNTFDAGKIQEQAIRKFSADTIIKQNYILYKEVITNFKNKKQLKDV